MIQLTTKINHRTSGLAIAVCLLLAVGIFGYYWFSINFQKTSQSDFAQKTNTQTTAVRAGRSKFFEAASSLKRYGNWPIVNVSLSPDRGNPFVPK